MRKKGLILSFLLIVILSINGQSLDGIYNFDGQSIKFHNHKVEYTLNTGGCLVTEYKGKGNFSIKNNRLFIRPYFKGLPKQIQSLKSKDKDSMTFHINHFDSIGVNIFLYRKGKFFKGIYTNICGVGKISRKQVQDCDSILFRNIGFEKLIFEPDKHTTLDYIVRLEQIPGMNRHKSFITNNGQGFAIKIYKDSVDIKYFQFVDCKQNEIWHKFIKEKAQKNKN